MQKINKRNIQQGNESIALFVGAIKEYDKEIKSDVYKNIPVHGWKQGEMFASINALCFHSSWDWLMPVVKKIAELAIKNSWIQKIENGEKAFTVLNMRLYPTIENAWLAVLDFIEWYNTQQLKITKKT